ncbi:unnamed protein product [Cylicostephanus goldi]|uniref:Uncharacterized protein n=1 Tax=Cylicostephanus goldi TaxID=71465 RepID=A0A3P6SPJ3_CYLGO|nr:unnamed protein product [Cylicostephanus goldi]
MDLEENDVDESKFEAMCSTKKCSLLDEWPEQNDQSAGDNWPEMKRSNGTAFDWPGNSQSSKGEATNFFPVQWDKAPADNSSEGEDWACFPQDTSTPKKAEGDDEWADFSSAKANESIGSGRFSDWPGVDAEITNASNAKPDPANPVMPGLATGVISTSLDRNAMNQSEC